MIPLSKKKSVNLKEEQYVALSKTREVGILNLVINCFSRKWITTSSFTFIRG
jgi:hypothetical protein